MEVVKNLKLDKYHDVEHLRHYTEKYGDISAITIEKDGYSAQVGPRLAFFMGSENMDDILYVLSNIEDKLDMLPVLQWNSEKGYYDTLKVIETKDDGSLTIVNIK